MGDADRIDWREDYRARAPNGDVLEADTQTGLVDVVDAHAEQHGCRNQDYTIGREGWLEPSYEG